MKQLKNIIIVNDFAKADGGAAMVAVESALALAEEYNVCFFTSVPPVDERLIQSKVKVHCLNKQDILNDKSRIRAIVKGLYDKDVEKEFKSLLSALDPGETIVHVHTWTKALTSAVFKVTAQMNFQVVLTLHDFFGFCPNGGFFNFKQKKICHLKSMSLDCITTNCDARSYPQKVWRMLRFVVQNKYLWANEKLTLLYISEFCRKVTAPYIPQGVRMVYSPDPVNLSENEKAPILENSQYLFLGRISPEKGASLFCQAISELGLRGLVVGDGYMRNTLEKKYPSIEFAGWASGDKKRRLMLKAKVLVFPSFWGETFGLSVAEAKSYGIPCIVPNQCAAAEQIEDGKTGFIFETGNIDSLKKAIIKYENSDIAQMQRTLVDSFDTKELSMETHLKRLVKIYRDILGDTASINEK